MGTFVQNHWFAVTTDLLGAILAIAGILPPILRGAVTIAHTLTIFANSSRLLSYQPEVKQDEPIL
jgi:cation transport ATPase